MTAALFLLGLGLIWGSSATLAKLAVTGGVSALAFTFWQTAIAATVLLIICVFRRTLPALDGQHLKYYLVCGLLGLSLPNANMYLTLEHIPAGVAAMVLTTSPLFTYLVVLATRMERFDWHRALGVTSGLVGALLLLLPEGALPAPQMVPWVALCFLTPALYAGINVFAARWLPVESDSLALACGMLYAAMLGLIPALVVTDGFHLPRLPFDVADWALTIQGILSAGAFVLFFQIIRSAGPVYLSQVGYIIVVTGVLLGMAVFDERHSPWIWAAMLFIALGLALVNWGHRRLDGAPG